jgi:hypothetical protein
MLKSTDTCARNAFRKSKRDCHKGDVQTPNTANPGPKMPNTATKMVTIIIKIPRKSTKVGKMASPLYPWVRRRTATCIGGRTADCPSPPTSKNLANWFPGPLKVQILFAFFFGAREDQPVLLRSRATCRLSRIFSEILQDRHRPPRDLADGLMRNSSLAKRGHHESVENRNRAEVIGRVGVSSLVERLMTNDA